MLKALFISAIVWNSTPSEAKTALRFHNGKTPPSQPVFLYGNETFVAQSMTICFRFRPDFYRPLTIFKNDGQEFKIEQLESGYGTLYINNESYTFDMTELNLRPRVWHNICYSYQTYQQGSLQEGQLKVNVNGIICMNQTIKVQTIQMILTARELAHPLWSIHPLKPKPGDKNRNKKVIVTVQVMT